MGGLAVGKQVDRFGDLIHHGVMSFARARLLLLGGGLVLCAALARAAEPPRQQRIAALPEEDRAWLTDFVAPIILPDEERVFLQLSEPGQREAFKEDFWRRRETPGLPLPLGPGYRDRYRDLRQVIDAGFIGWETDAARLILRRGKPDSISKPRCDGDEVFRDLEIWTYSGLELNGHAATRHIFFRPPNAPRRLWIVHDGNAVFKSGACRASFDQLSKDCRPVREDTCAPCPDRCVVYEVWADIMKRTGGPAGAVAEQADLLNYPKIPMDGLDRSKSKWVLPPGVAAKPPAAGITPPAPTPTAVPRPTATPVPTPVVPTAAPRPTVTPVPTAAPRPVATAEPVPQAAPRPTIVPTAPPAVPPTSTPSAQATRAASPERTAAPSSPTAAPTRVATTAPIRPPTSIPTTTPTNRPTAGPAGTPAPTRVVEGMRRLSPEEVKNRIETLEPEYKEFVDLARPLLSDEELSRFLQLSGHDKDAFMRDFWKRHS